MRADEVILREAEFNPKVRDYWLLSGAIGLFATCIFSPLAILWYILGRPLVQRYLDRMSCILTDKTLKVQKGIFTRVEKSVPLDKITDLGMVQGPIMRLFGVEALSIETAGGGTGPGGASQVQLAGILDAREFRDAVLEQRDRVAIENRQSILGAPSAAAPAAEAQGADVSVLEDIRASLGRIEEMMRERQG